MWLPDRCAFPVCAFLVCAFAPGACGFEPVHAPGGTSPNLTGQTEITAPSERNSFDLVRRLEERLGRPQGPRYRLGYTIRIVQDDLGVTPSQEITRYNLVGEVDFTLTRMATGDIASSGTVRSFTSYAATGSTLGTQTARQDAFARLMVILADRIVSRLLSATGGESP